ncbi:MAG: hypothetical protein ABW123_15665 [Cystobacter sp.]
MMSEASDFESRASRSSWGRRMVCLLGLGLLGCGSSIPVDRPSPAPFQPLLVRAQADVAAVPGFADQTGGGIFATAAGEAVRLRLDGSRAGLENHPGNRVVPGRINAVFRMGTGSALVESSNGLFLAQSGWLIAPPWREWLGQGLRATASTAEGTAWLAHDSGLYRLRDGQLAALKVSGQTLDGIRSLVAAPADKSASALWMLRDGQLRVAVQTASDVWQVRPADVPLEDDETVVSLVGLGGSAKGSAEAWVLTSGRLLRRTERGWRAVMLPGAPSQVLASGRFVWVKSGAELFSYDADLDTWGMATNVDTREFQFLAADESGCAWVQLGAETLALSWGPVPRVLGLYDGMKVVEDTLVVRARVAPGDKAPERVVFEVAGAQVPTTGPAYSLGGVETDGTPRSYSFAGLTPGQHMLNAVAHYADGTQARRSVSFAFEPLSTVTLGFEKDIRPIHAARCAKCHESTGPGRPLSTYKQWKDNADLILAAVREQRMPADGPLDPQLLTLLQRWVATGANP